MRLRNATVAGEGYVGERMDVTVEGDRILAVDPSRELETGAEDIDCLNVTVYPGFIDVHIHGAVGFDVNEADVDGLLAVAEFLAKNGVTAWVPTLVPDSDEAYARAIWAIDELMQVQTKRPIAQAVGVHYEGVFANEKMCGALRPQYFKNGRWWAQGGRLPKLKTGIHLTTLAPEVEGGIDLIREMVGDGWVASIGHTRSDVETLEGACDAGARHVTHFFNAMTGIHHRDVGVAGWALTKPEVTVDIIADGVHVHPRMLEMACRHKTPGRTVLISDSVAPTGLGDGVYDLWDGRIEVKNGRTRNDRGSIAGSVITMFDAVKGILSVGFGRDDAAKMASANPARLLGLEATRGSIAAGKRADILGVDHLGTIAFVMVGGKLVEM